MLLSNQNWLAFVYLACLTIPFFSLPNLIIYKAYAISQSCALTRDGTVHVCDIQNINPSVIVEYPVESW